MLAERCKTLKEMASASRYFFEEFESFDEAAVKKHFKAAAIEPLEKVKEKLDSDVEFIVSKEAKDPFEFI